MHHRALLARKLQNEPAEQFIQPAAVYNMMNIYLFPAVTLTGYQHNETYRHRIDDRFIGNVCPFSLQMQRIIRREREENLFEWKLLYKQKLQSLDIKSAGKWLEFGNVRERAVNGSGMEYVGIDAAFEKMTFCGEF